MEETNLTIEELEEGLILEGENESGLFEVTNGNYEIFYYYKDDRNIGDAIVPIEKGFAMIPVVGFDSFNGFEILNIEGLKRITDDDLDYLIKLKKRYEEKQRNLAKVFDKFRIPLLFKDES